jgi:hypothetical protein
MTLSLEYQRISAEAILDALACDEEIRLSHCTIEGDLDLNRWFGDNRPSGKSCQVAKPVGDNWIVEFSRPVAIVNCTMEGHVFFAGPWDSPEAVNVVFHKPVQFNSSVFRGQARFCRAQFQASVSFDGCTFQRVCCLRETLWRSSAMIRTADLEGYVLLQKAIFEKEVRLTNTSFGKGVNFAQVRFGDKADFSGVHSRSKAVPQYEGVWFARQRVGEDETFWRFIKQAAQEAGDYQKAGENFYRERCGNFRQRLRGGDYESLSPALRMIRLAAGVRLLPEFVFGRLLFGYGERPGRILIAAILVILCCASFYASPWAKVIAPTIGPAYSPEWFDGLYLSVMTFTTVGYGDFHPDPSSYLTRMVAMAEAMSGMVLTAMFVVAMAKRYSRG